MDVRAASRSQSPRPGRDRDHARHRIPSDSSLPGRHWLRRLVGQHQQAVCTHILPFFLDLQLSYGLHPRVDLIVDLRFALQKDPATYRSHQFALAPGIRYWLDQDVALKFYATGQFVWDYTYYDRKVSNSDVGIRNADGLMYDAIKNVGFFFQVGWTMGFSRWFRMEFDTGLGVQLRFP